MACSISYAVFLKGHQNTPRMSGESAPAFLDGAVHEWTGVALYSFPDREQSIGMNSNRGMPMRFPLTPMAVFLLISLFAPITFANVTAENQCGAYQSIPYEVLGSIDRTRPGFTEGLIFDGERLIESTGSHKSNSTINAIDPSTGQVTVLRDTPHGAFGEGLAKLGSQYFQLTYKENEVFVYDAQTLELKRVVPNRFSKEGWGLGVLNDQLIASDGTNRLHVLDPNTLAEKRAIEVRDYRGRKISNLNELEVIGNSALVNIYMTNYIYKVDLESGCVTGAMDMAPLLRDFDERQLNRIKADGNNVLNGIAYDPSRDVYYITGKNWPKIFQVRIPRQTG